jgi:hypothetical protein
MTNGIKVLLKMQNGFLQLESILDMDVNRYSYDHGISSVILLSTRKKLCSLSFIVIILKFLLQKFCHAQ